MREIKFRCWFPAQDGIPAQMISHNDLCLDALTKNGGVGQGETLMQFTGIKDKNGVEIYEGDAVKIHNYPDRMKNGEPDFDWRVFAVEYNQYTWAFNNRVIYSPLSAYDTFDGTEFDIEVIGNIYQHPNLLENK